MRFVLLTIVLSLSIPAAALDLTGTWEGKMTCTALAFGAKDKFTFAGTLMITQVGDTLAVGTAAGGDASYEGIAVADLTKPEKGEAGLAHCGTDDDLSGG